MTAVAALLLVAPPSLAADDTASVPNGAEAWYTSLPVLNCSAPIGCPPIAPPATPSPYPAHTLHVSASVGQETARTYVEPDFSALPSGATLVAGTLVLPLSAAANAGNTNQATAQIEACLVTQVIADGVSGSTGQPPATDCKVNATAKYDANAKQFTVDLAPFLSAWASGSPPDGISLQPSATESPATSWSVAFNGRDLPDAPHITSMVTLLSGPASSASDSSSPGPAFTPSDATPLSPTQDVVPPLLTAPGPSIGAAATPGRAPTRARSVIAGSERASNDGFQYSAVMLLPLAFLAGLAFLTRVFTSDATPRRRLRL
jgi:hypothetical protein